MRSLLLRPRGRVGDRGLARAVGGAELGLLSLFGGLALALSTIGVFGVVSQVVAARTHEFGIRAALGGVPQQLVGLGLRAGARQVGLGLALGVVLALALAVTGAVALAASAWPARRAARADPATVLHEG